MMASIELKVETSTSLNSLEEKVNDLQITEPGVTNGTHDSSTVDGKCLGKMSKVDGKAFGDISSQQFPLPSGYASASSNAVDESYNMNHKKRGHCLIFNQKKFSDRLSLGDRNGTDADRDNVSQIFKCLGYEVHVENDNSFKEIKTTLEKYSSDVDHSDCDSFVVVFMTHGEQGNLFARDSIFKTDLLYSNFTANNCQSLAGKPKMFFIQACRGDGLDEGTKMLKRVPDQTDSGAISMYKIPNHADFLMCWSTVPGYYSWRNTSNGSWFIQSLCQVFAEYAHKMDVLSMMTIVNRHLILNFESNCPSAPSMHSKKQTASVVSTLMRSIYLKPKA